MFDSWNLKEISNIFPTTTVESRYKQTREVWECPTIWKEKSYKITRYQIYEQIQWAPHSETLVEAIEE